MERGNGKEEAVRRTEPEEEERPKRNKRNRMERATDQMREKIEGGRGNRGGGNAARGCSTSGGHSAFVKGH